MNFRPKGIVRRLPRRMFYDAMFPSEEDAQMDGSATWEPVPVKPMDRTLWVI